MKYSRKYKGVDGRVSVVEADVRTQEPRQSVIENLAYFEQISAADIFRMEGFLWGMDGNTFPNTDTLLLDNNTRRRIVREFGLKKEDPNNPKSRWIGDKKAVFARLCEKYVSANKYKSYNDILYAMRYGNPHNGNVIVTKGGGSDG